MTKDSSQIQKVDGCECFTDYLNKVREQVEPQIPEGAAELEISWQNRVFLLSGGDYPPVVPKVEVEYRRPKKGGGHAKAMTRDVISIIPNFCPFCGRKYRKSEDVS